MIGILGYDFCCDENALNPSPLRQSAYNSVKLTNGIFSHWYITNDVSSPYSSTEPTAWDYLTVMDANFNGTLNAGNVDYVMDNIDGIRIKRRKINEYNWTTLTYISTSDFGENLSFTVNDYLNQNGVTYEYAFVPVSEGVEGEYITNTIDSKFDGVFICDFNTIYKFYTGVSYGTMNRVQKVGVFEPLGRKYPVIVSNALLNYNTGSVAGDILNDDFFETKVLDKLATAEKRERLLDFLTNKKAKILKDWNGNYWLMMITDNPAVSYEKDSGLRLMNLNASWTEIGDANSNSDLYNTGLLTESQI